ncbi:MAG TPA: FecR family protein [Methylomirabilota bacterium]|jgi:hypothetical protein|nr:FecR family protein [Methylomirabilota bacterium]
MSGLRASLLSRGVVLAVFGGLLVLALADKAHAQRSTTTAEIKTVAGQVEFQRLGQTQWAPALPGTKLGEGDNVRTHPGASAVLDLPDGSALFVAENSRVVVAKLEVDRQSQNRQALFHLVVGKVRAAVAQASITLVRARQSNFAISTPTAVAAARGTIFEVVYDAAQKVMRVAVLVEDPQKPTGLVTCTTFFDRFTTVLVREGFAAFGKATEGCTPPIPNSALPDADRLGTLSNPVPPGPTFFGPVNVPSPGDIPGLAFGLPGVVFTSEPPVLSPQLPSPLGQDIRQQPVQTLGTSVP